MCKGDTAGGRWTVTESNCHINELETLAAFFCFEIILSLNDKLSY